MTKSSFDPQGAVEFDLPRGVVRGSGDRLLVVPAGVVDDITREAGASAAANVARAIGAACGKRVLSRLDGVGNVLGASIESALSHLAGELAIAGVGALSLERWGRALVAVVDNSAISDNACVAAVVQGAICAATARPVACVALVREENSVRVLVTSGAAALRARGWLAEGVSWGDVLARLQSRGDA